MIIIDDFENLPKFKNSISHLSKTGVCFSGLRNISKQVLINSLQRLTGMDILVITKGAKEADQILEGLETIKPDNNYSFPSWELLPHEGFQPDIEITAERFKTLNALVSKHDMGSVITVSTLSAIIQKTITPCSFMENVIHIKLGQQMDFSTLIRGLFAIGYKRSDRIESVGQYSVRGGIIDIYSISNPMPYRVEFWGDCVDTIRLFNPQSQLSEHNVSFAEIFPVDEYGFYKKGNLSGFMEHIGENTIIILDEPEQLRKKLSQLNTVAQNRTDFYLTYQELINDILRFPHASVSQEIHSAEPFFSGGTPVVFGISLPSFLDKLSNIDKKSPNYIDESLYEIKELIIDGYKIILSFNNNGEKQRFFEICLDKKFDIITSCQTIIGQISGGFVCPEAKLAVISDHEIFGRYKARRSGKKFQYCAPIREIIDVNPGDLVVHANYGIGLYQGIHKTEQNGALREMMLIEYANKAKLFVPMIHSNLVRRYIGCGYNETPSLDVLGTSSWQKKRQAVEESILGLASELLETQAVRKTMDGVPCRKDTSWQREFEASFIYQETPDQINSIQSVKEDMESPKPMDRLICGDVGYGKTEVAIRAAFKAVTNNKQVAVLVPTTILAQQHYKVFSERMADYPIKVEMLSRFKTPSQQREIIKESALGNIDILIGTHRIVQHDVKFKELGLVIIDEEQRFGVKHKEQFKMLRKLVDVLTLTATPIPRTLYMSLVGARDMSTINTPPEDRLPVETFVTSFDDKIIQHAINRELNREGQLFFVHNRVKSIHKIKEKIEQLAPDAKIAVGHGQMHEKELARVMDDFRAGNIDILVCTTIIEAGLDIPNANTIIIDRADMFGLADLYQLRGRVGRFKTRAYAYFLVPPHKVPTEQAQKRLDAIETHQQLGAGFQIAMRDLEIRGAGNILGERQHGNIVAVGFDLYCKLLKNTIASIKGEVMPQPPKVVLKLGFEPQIPVDYIPSEAQRLAIYSRLQDTYSEDQVIELEKELSDIYGQIPCDVKTLLNCVLIKIYASEKSIDYIELKDDKLIINSGEFSVTENGIKHYRVKNGDDIKKTESIKSILKNIDQNAKIADSLKNINNSNLSKG